MSDTYLYSSHPRQGGYPLAGARLAGFCLFLVLMLVVSAPARAEAPAADCEPQSAICNLQSPMPTFAFLGLDKWAASLTTRTNIVRFCVCIMALALFIMIKK
jgi:hypothetical protein